MYRRCYRHFVQAQHHLHRQVCLKGQGFVQDICFVPVLYDFAELILCVFLSTLGNVTPLRREITRKFQNLIQFDIRNG